MSGNKPIYISSISGGKCLENTQQAKGECRLRKWNKESSAQRWIAEPDVSNPNILAFKSASDGQYLAALQPDKRNGGKIGVQSEKQWFTLEPSLRGPGWFYVKCNSSFGGGKAGYFNDEWGRLNDDNKIQTYQWESNNPGFNTFYFSIAEAADKQTFDLGATSTDDGAEVKKREEELKDRESKVAESEKKAKELEKREKELQGRESKVQENEKKSKEQQNALSEKEAVLRKREEELARKEKESKPAAAAPKSEDASAKVKALEEKERKLSEREAQLRNREEELARKEKDGKSVNSAPPSNDHTEQTRALEEKEKALAERERVVERREREASSMSRAAQSRTPSIASNQTEGARSHDEVHEVCRLRRENDELKFKLKIGELEAELREKSCKHKVKRPPRKLDHKVSGYVYVD